MDKKGIKKLLTECANNQPDEAYEVLVVFITPFGAAIKHSKMASIDMGAMIYAVVENFNSNMEFDSHSRLIH